MILIFDTFGGLCNQMYDIHCGINFCIHNNIKFSFRYCSFRNNNLTSWYNEKVTRLFDMSFLTKYHNLYVDYDNLNLTSENTYNYQSEHAVRVFTNNFINEIKIIDKEFIVLKQFFALHKFQNIVENVFPILLPSKNLVAIYKEIKDKILTVNEKYNFIHYRYENDFTNYFNIQVKDLKSIILTLKKKFKNPDLKIYIACSNINKLIDLNNPELHHIIISKNENELQDYNFEEKAFIDYVFGLHSNEIFGHSKSSFSTLINNFKNTSNYYDAYD
jgi:hypothetical protein